MVIAVCTFCFTICFTTALIDTALIYLQVGMVTAVCTICFTVRALMIELSTANSNRKLIPKSPTQLIHSDKITQP